MGGGKSSVEATRYSFYGSDRGVISELLAAPCLVDIRHRGPFRIATDGVADEENTLAGESVLECHVHVVNPLE